MERTSPTPADAAPVLSPCPAALRRRYPELTRAERRVAVALSNSGDVPPLAAALREARAAGATAVATTNVVGSPVAEAAEVRLFTAARESWVWSEPVSSPIPMLGVVDALYACVALLRHRAGRAVHVPVTRPSHARSRPRDVRP